jgi:thymidylate synthase
VLNAHISSIEARDIPDAWFQCLLNVQKYGFKYPVEQGSFIGTIRLELDWITVYIKYPYAEPYDLMLPRIPLQYGIPNPVAYGYVEQYLPYLMTDTIEKGEDYTYGSRIWPQVPHFIELLKKTPNTNQAILQVARPEDSMLNDPPCLRHIDIRIRDKETLVFYPYFRSWDLWGGFPANLAAIAVLHKYMADEIGIQQGPIIAASKGLHFYGYVENLAKVVTYYEDNKQEEK